MELDALNSAVAEFENLSATLVAVSPQTTDHNAKLIKARKLNFEILWDNKNAYAEQLGLKHGLPDDLKAVYGQFGIDLDASNGNPDWELAIPARFVVSTDGVIRAADFNADYTIRPEPAATVDALRNLSSNT